MVSLDEHPVRLFQRRRPDDSGSVRQLQRDRRSDRDHFLGSRPRRQRDRDRDRLQLQLRRRHLHLAGRAGSLRHGPSANGILEAGTGDTIVATYDNSVTAVVSASAPVNCDPDLINASFASASTLAFTQRQVTVGGGCDQDAHLDSGEVVTYGVALQNKSRTDDYADLNAILTPTAGATGAVRILDSPKNMGRLPGSGTTSAFFHIFVDPAQIPANPERSLGRVHPESRLPVQGRADLRSRATPSATRSTPTGSRCTTRPITRPAAVRFAI